MVVINSTALVLSALASTADAVERWTVSTPNPTNIVTDVIRFDNIVPPMRRNGVAWQPKHSTKVKNKRRAAARGRA